VRKVLSASCLNIKNALQFRNDKAVICSRSPQQREKLSAAMANQVSMLVKSFDQNRYEQAWRECTQPINAMDQTAQRQVCSHTIPSLLLHQMNII